MQADTNFLLSSSSSGSSVLAHSGFFKCVYLCEKKTSVANRTLGFISFRLQPQLMNPAQCDPYVFPAALSESSESFMQQVYGVRMCGVVGGCVLMDCWGRHWVK